MSKIFDVIIQLALIAFASGLLLFLVALAAAAWITAPGACVILFVVGATCFYFQENRS